MDAGEVVRVTGPLSYQVRADVGVVRRHVDNIRRMTSEAIDAPEEENIIDDFEELTRPTVVDSSIKNPITSPAAINVSTTPSSPVVSNFPVNLTLQLLWPKITPLIQILFVRHLSIPCVIHLDRPLPTVIDL